MKLLKPTLQLRWFWLATVVSAAAADVPDPPITPDQAVYQIKYKGRNAGTSEFIVSYEVERDTYRFSSSTKAKGLYRFISPRPIVERSDFAVRNGTVTPLEFWYEDGSRKGKENLHTVFDWASSVAVIDGEHGRLELELSPGALDRGSMQVAVMRDVASGRQPGPYVLADEDSLKTYELSAEGEEQISTPLGDFSALRFKQQRQGSSRSTVMWFVPELQYLPAIIEQHRGDEVRTAFILESVEGLD